MYSHVAVRSQCTEGGPLPVTLQPRLQLALVSPLSSHWWSETVLVARTDSASVLDPLSYCHVHPSWSVAGTCGRETLPSRKEITNRLNMNPVKSCSALWALVYKRLTAGTDPMLFIWVGWLRGDAARGPIGAGGICTFPMGMLLN